MKRLAVLVLLAGCAAAPVQPVEPVPPVAPPAVLDPAPATSEPAAVQTTTTAAVEQTAVEVAAHGVTVRVVRTTSRQAGKTVVTPAPKRRGWRWLVPAALLALVYLVARRKPARRCRR